jgi:hypothetical protein
MGKLSNIIPVSDLRRDAANIMKRLWHGAQIPKEPAIGAPTRHSTSFPNGSQE